MRYGTGEFDDPSTLPTEIDGTKLILSDKHGHSTGYLGVALNSAHWGNTKSSRQEEFPYKVEYRADAYSGDMVRGHGGIRKSKTFATKSEAALWYARNVHPLVEQHKARQAESRERQEMERLAKEEAKVREREARDEERQRVKRLRAEEKASAANKKGREVITPSPVAQAVAQAAPAAEGMARVTCVLAGCRLEQYAAALEEQGWDDYEYLTTQPFEQLRQLAIGVGMKAGHATKFAWALGGANSEAR